MINTNIDTIPLLNRDNIAFHNVILPLDLTGKEIARGLVRINDHKIVATKVIDYDTGRYLDCRNWIRYGKSDSFHPLKDGFHISIKNFKDYQLDIFNNVLQYC